MCLFPLSRLVTAAKSAASSLQGKFLAEGSIHEHTTLQGSFSHQTVHSFKALAILRSQVITTIYIFYIFTTVKSCPFFCCQLSSEPAPPLEEEALLFDLLDVRKEKRLMRRREKLPDFLWLLAAEGTKLFPMLGRSSWD